MTAPRPAPVGAAARPGIAWRWDDALFGAVCAVPAAIVAFSDAPKALAFAFGTFPALVVGIAPQRSKRGAVVAVGALMGVSILAGSVLAGVPWLAVAALFALAVGASQLAERAGRLGMVVLTLALPLVGVGFSYDDLATTGGLAVILTLGSVFAAIVSMAWPERPAPVAPPAAPVPSLLGYGVRLGAAGATAAAIGFAFDWDHVGWAVAACLLVMRPSPDLVTTRGVGRLVSVLLGGLAGVVLATLTTSGAVYAVAIVAVLAATSATHTSRWYVTSAFTTFLVLSMVAYGTSGAEAAGRFNERLGETVLGVALAFVFGTALPRLAARRSPAPDAA